MKRLGALAAQPRPAKALATLSFEAAFSGLHLIVNNQRH